MSSTTSPIHREDTTPRSSSEMQRPRIQDASNAKDWILYSLGHLHKKEHLHYLKKIQNNAARFVHQKHDWNNKVIALKIGLTWTTYDVTPLA